VWRRRFLTDGLDFRFTRTLERSRCFRLGRSLTLDLRWSSRSRRPRLLGHLKQTRLFRGNLVSEDLEAGEVDEVGEAGSVEQAWARRVQGERRR
jgi:hypothetical protein